MKTVTVHASKDYEIRIGSGLIGTLSSPQPVFDNAASAAIISDDIVFPLYGEALQRALEAAGLTVFSFVFPHGEKEKTLSTYARALNFLAERRLSRKDLVFALGGGVAGDLAGFVAATYLRGIRYVQVPTTLLAAVDSSVGGKTAVDLEAGKNLAGAFHQPSLVVCDTDVFQTLPEEQWQSGAAETVKYGLFGNAAFYRSLRETPIRDQLEAVIGTAVTMKRDIVERDEFETGERMLLNYGHTFGHAVERLSGYTLLHGQAVAIGMASIARAAAAYGYCSRETALETEDILRRYGLPTELPFTASEMSEAMKSDKKADGGMYRLIVPEAIGACRIISVPAGEIEGWLTAGGAK